MVKDRTEFDLYKLSDFNEGKGSIKAIFSDRDEVMNIVDKLKSNRKIIEFCNRYGIHYSTLWRYSKSSKLPLFILKDFRDVVDAKKIIHLEYGTGDTKRSSKPILHLTEDLAKILGAFAADGHLKQRLVNRGEKRITHYELVFVEQYENTMKALSKWLENVFGINIKLQKISNHYRIYISNKIIFRYFRLFGFTSGRKTETVSAPDFIKSSDRDIKISFIRGVLMFDGYVNKTNGYIELYSKSRSLIKDICEMLKEIGIEADYINAVPDKLGRHRFIIRKQEKLEKCLIFFEPNTEKWIRLHNCIKDFRNKRKGGLEMAKDRTDEITELMKQPDHIRNIAIAAHID